MVGSSTYVLPYCSDDDASAAMLPRTEALPNVDKTYLKTRVQIIHTSYFLFITRTEKKMHTAFIIYVVVSSLLYVGAVLSHRDAWFAKFVFCLLVVETNYDE